MVYCHLNWVPRRLELRSPLKAGPVVDMLAGSAEIRYCGDKGLSLEDIPPYLHCSPSSSLSSWRPAGTPSSRPRAPCAGRMSETNLTVKVWYNAQWEMQTSKFCHFKRGTMHNSQCNSILTLESNQVCMLKNKDYLTPSSSPRCIVLYSWTYSPLIPFLFLVIRHFTM